VEEKHHPEFYLLLATSTLSMMMLVSSIHLLTLYICLEISSYSLYILTYLRKGKRIGLEAGMKYFVIGSVTSAIMLFGFVLLYSTAQSAYLADLGRFIPEHIGSPVVLIGLILSLSGFLFKLAVFPFHLWAPDVYEGAPHQVAAFIATVSKVAAMAVLMRLVNLAGGLSQNFTYYLIFLAVVTMTLGNLAAIAQKDFKRLLAFSSVAHAGYILIGILSQNAIGQQGIIFYAVSILIMKYTCFLVLIYVAEDGRNIEILQLAGLHRRSPLLALALLLALFGLAGIPPTIGFTAKLLIFMAAMEKGFLFLVILAMINVVISLYYYLQVLKAAYFLEPEQQLPALNVPLPIKILTIGLIFLIVAVGVYPYYLIQIARFMLPNLT
jgi:NADH-quinone oxidoreductase subunit N